MLSEIYLCNKSRFKKSNRSWNKKSLKSEIVKSDIDKVETTPVDLSKLSDAAKMKLLQRWYMVN